MRMLVFPWDPNPYQRLLYDEMQHLDVQVTYIGNLTPSRTLNLLLLPLEVLVYRIAGARLIHLHWVFAFAFPGTGRFPMMRRVAYIWFLLWLRTCKVLRMYLIWTAHNVLPHEPVFADDVSARRTLVQASSLVVAHSSSALTELAALGAIARRSAVIRHGPITPIRSASSVATPSERRSPRRFLFFGRVQDYKGVDDLLTAFSAIPDDIAVHLTVAGQCDDPKLRSRLYELAQPLGAGVTLRLERVPDDEVAPLLAANDIMVLPFRHVTTSGSAMLALAHKKPLVAPRLPGLADLPDQAVLWYDGKIPTLVDALLSLALADSDTLAAMSAAAGEYASTTTWRHIAERTVTDIRLMLGDIPEADLRGRSVSIPSSRLR